MIKRTRYTKEQKERLTLEIISGQTSMAEISKREAISADLHLARSAGR